MVLVNGPMRISGGWMFQINVPKFKPREIANLQRIMAGMESEGRRWSTSYYY